MYQLQRTMSLALIGLLLLLCAPMAVAWRSLQEISASSQRTSVAHEVLEAHLMLGFDGERLVNHLDRGGLADDPAGRAIRSSINEQVAHIRNHIAEEIGIIGKKGAAEETEEFDRLDRIAATIALSGQGNSTALWREEIKEAIAHEHSELSELKSLKADAISRIQSLMILTLTGSGLALALGLLWLRRTVAIPSIALFGGMQQIMAGDRTHRIEPSGQPGMRELHRVFNEMAEQLAAGAKIEALNRKELEDAVASRSADLNKANEELVQASERRTQFLADISHELRTPLAIIGGETDVALRNPDASALDFRGSLTRVQSQARGMARLVDDLLFMARTEAGPATARLRPLDLLGLIRTTTGSLQPLLAADGGKLEFRAELDSALILGDEGRLRQLLGILLDNAIHYSEQAPQIDISLDQVGQDYMVAVRDTGIGIDPTELPFLFERFRRGSRAIEKNDEGAGLGLPLAKAIAESHGGSITIESAPGAGTTVVLLLPAAARERAGR